MLYLILPYLIQLALVVHIIKTGRNTLWVWLVIFVPFIGGLAYFIVEILPGLMGSHTARRAASTLRKTVDPARDLRQAHQQLRVNDSVDSRRKLADELLERGRVAEALEHYRAAMTGIYSHEPLLMLGAARAQFAQGEFGAARETLDALIQHNPDFKSAQGHLLYARALEAEGDTAKALEEYRALGRYYSGAEALYRHGALLKKSGQVAAGNQLLKELLEHAEVAGAVFRREQREWLDLAKKETE